MPNTYTQIDIHLVFAVKHRDGLITPSFQNDLYKYITGIFRNKNQKLLAINGMSDHLHILFGMEPDICLSDLVRDVKSDSSLFINQNKFIKTKFHWQEGFGAFSYSHSQRDMVINYIKNQQEHHRKKTFKEEYVEFLKRFNVEYDEKFLFEFFD
jgi:putative transposase